MVLEHTVNLLTVSFSIVFTTFFSSNYSYFLQCKYCLKRNCYIVIRKDSGFGVMEVPLTTPTGALENPTIQEIENCLELAYSRKNAVLLIVSTIICIL